jgi:hypothetical protein
MLWLLGCASGGAPVPPTSTAVPSPSTSEPAATLYTRIPSQIGQFKLTERMTVRGMADSIYRFSDGSKTNLSVIVFDVTIDGGDNDTQKWVALEGNKFQEAQEIRRNRGLIAAYVLAYSDTTRFLVGSRNLLEHNIAMPTRYPNGAITVEMQYLYLIDNKFVKVRGSIPEPGWQQTRVPSFARELARRLAGGT